MTGDGRTPEELARDAEIGRRLQAELPGYQDRFEPDDEPERDDESDDDETDDEADDGDERPPTLLRPLVQEGGCLDPGCWPDFIVVPALLLWHLGRGVAWLLRAGRRRFRHHRDERRRARGREPWTPPTTLAGPPLRPPARWADAQRELHATYDRDPASLPRRRARVTRTDAVTVRVSTGSPRSMTFAPLDDPDGPRWSGPFDGVLVGEIGTNAAACVEVAGGVLWPAYNPVGR